MSIFKFRKPVTVRKVEKGVDGLYYVVRKSMFGNSRLDSHGFKHSTSAWAHLGKLTVREQEAD